MGLKMKIALRLSRGLGFLLCALRAWRGRQILADRNPKCIQSQFWCQRNGPKLNPTERKESKRNQSQIQFLPVSFFFNFRKRAENISSVRFSKLLGPFPYFLRSVSSFIQVRFLYFFCRFPLIFGRLTHFFRSDSSVFLPISTFFACFHIFSSHFHIFF